MDILNDLLTSMYIDILCPMRQLSENDTSSLYLYTMVSFFEVLMRKDGLSIWPINVKKIHMRNVLRNNYFIRVVHGGGLRVH